MVPGDAIARRTDEEAAASWQATLANPERAPFVVTEVSGEGVIVFARASAPEPEELGYDCELWKLYIRETYQRRGVGGLLMAAIAERLRAHGMHSLMLRALVGNQADGFYERLGGHSLGTAPYEILGVELPTVLYGWPDLSVLCNVDTTATIRSLEENPP